MHLAADAMASATTAVRWNSCPIAPESVIDSATNSPEFCLR